MRAPQIASRRSAARAPVAAFGRSMELAEANDDPYMVAYAQRALAQAYAAAGDRSAAHHRALAALALFQRLAIAGEVSATEQLLATLGSERSVSGA